MAEPIDTSTSVLRHHWGLPLTSYGNMYLLSIINIGGLTNGPIDLETKKLAGGGNPGIWASKQLVREFAFNVNPKSMNLEEPFSVTIVPTQNGSQFIENQGMIYKNISISGTTGLRPNRKAPGGIT